MISGQRSCRSSSASSRVAAVDAEGTRTRRACVIAGATSASSGATSEREKMPNSKESMERRKELRVWIDDPDGGYWYAETQPPERHGRKSTYVNWGCGCPDCTLANTNQQRIKRHGNRIATFAAKRKNIFSSLYSSMVREILKR